MAVLPFTPSSDAAKEKEFAAKIRYAVGQKLSADANGVEANGVYDRKDNVEVDNLVSALSISFAPGKGPSEEDMQSLLEALNTDYVIAGSLNNRTLTLTLYDRGKQSKISTVEIPPDNESPKLAFEKVLSDLTRMTFAHVRDVEADHSDARAEARFAAAENLVADPGFELAVKDPKKMATSWERLLEAAHDAPPLMTAEAAKTLPADHAAIVPATVAGDPKHADGHVLMMRMSRRVAESNGLAVESTWIPVEQHKKYRFSAQYKSDGPTARIFLKGFAEKADAFGDKNDPEAARREFYRAQVLPRNKNAAFELIEMDFTPGTLKATDPKIQWIRVDLYVYLHPGDIFFDDIVVKKLDE
jgi:hypothetical protein